MHEIAHKLVIAAAELTGFSESEIIGKKRTTRLVNTRWAIWLVLRRQKYSYPEIANFTHHDHGAVIHGVKRAEQMQPTDEWMNHIIGKLTEMNARVLPLKNLR